MYSVTLNIQTIGFFNDSLEHLVENMKEKHQQTDYTWSVAKSREWLSV